MITSNGEFTRFPQGSMRSSDFIFPCAPVTEPMWLLLDDGSYVTGSSAELCTSGMSQLIGKNSVPAMAAVEDHFSFEGDVDTTSTNSSIDL